MSTLDDLTAVRVPAAAGAKADSDITVTGTAAGDGTTELTVTNGLGGPYSITPTVSDSPTVQAAALALVIDAGPDFNAVPTAAAIALIDKNAGAAGNTKVLSDTSTDTNTGITVDQQPANGVSFNQKSDVSITSVDESFTIVVPEQWLVSQSALLHRELKAQGWTLDGPDAGKVMSKSFAIAASLRSQI